METMPGRTMRQESTDEHFRWIKSREGGAARHRAGVIVIALTFALLSSSATAAPLALLDRNGSYVSIETYAPNIVRVTLSVDKDLALAAPGYGFIGVADTTGWESQAGASGDGVSSAARRLGVAG